MVVHRWQRSWQNGWGYGVMTEIYLPLAAERIGNEELTEDTINDLNYKRNDVASAGITGVMGMGNIPIYNQMFLEQAKIIRKLANYGSVSISWKMCRLYFKRY